MATFLAEDFCEDRVCAPRHFRSNQSAFVCALSARYGMPGENDIAGSENNTPASNADDETVVCHLRPCKMLLSGELHMGIPFGATVN